MRKGIRVGIDVGDARIGVAVSDTCGLLVLPARTVPTHPHGKAVNAIASFAKEKQAIEVVVGLPLNMRGDEGLSAQKARMFACRLAKTLPNVRICMFDERLSTVDAHARLAETGLNSRKQRNVVDQVAAQIILERALETECATKTAPGEEVRVDDQDWRDSK